MDHSYDTIYYTEDSEDTQDMYSQDMSVPVTELNTEVDATFIDIVRDYPHLYAKNLKEFKDKNVRERSWEEIASILNSSVEDCQRRWTRLRERFARERKSRDAETRSGSGSITGRKEWTLYKNMMFLSEHIQSRKTYTNLRPPNQPMIKAHSEISCNSLSARIVRNPQSPTLVSLSLLQSPSTSESMPFSPVSPASSRNNPSPQMYTRQQSPIPKNIPLSKNSAFHPIRSSTQSSSSHNLTIPVTSPQSILTPQSLSDCEKLTNSGVSSQESISTPKRRSEDMEQEEKENFIGRWIQRKKRTNAVEANFLKVSSELSSYLKNSQNTTSNASDVESFGKWISCELGKLPEMDKKQKMEKITQIIFS